jgi:hypothetical protein
MLIRAFHDEKAMTLKEFLRRIQELHDPELTKGWVNDFIGRHLGELQVCRSLSHEDLRMAVSRHLTGKVGELVLNLDELGSADWEDRKPKKVIAPAAVRKEDVYHPASRRHRHATLLACVSASGDALTSLIITAAPVRDALWSRGLRQDEDAMIRQRSPAYITEDLFSDYISTEFIPYVLTVRDRSGLEDEMAVLLMDSAVPDTSELVRRLLGENNIIAITFPAQTANLFQALGLVFFGVLKKLKVSATGEFDDDSTNAQITTLIQASEQTATSATIRGSEDHFGRQGWKLTRKLGPSNSEWLKRDSEKTQDSMRCGRVTSQLKVSLHDDGRRDLESSTQSVWSYNECSRMLYFAIVASCIVK